MARGSKQIKRLLAVMERAFRAGHEIALSDCVALCHAQGWPLPAWAFDVLAALASDEASGKKATKKMGRHSRSRAHQMQLVADARCFEAVEALRKDGLTWTGAFEKASEELPLTAEGARKAYSRVKRSLASGSFYVSWLYLEFDIVSYCHLNDLW